MRERKTTGPAAVAILAAAAIALASWLVVVDRDEAQAAPTRPNYVVIQTDDMAMKDLQSMPFTNGWFKDESVWFKNYMTGGKALCCPNRVSALEGRYAKNHGVTDNDGGFQKYRDSGEQAVNLVTRLDDAGYRAIHVGKYLNGFCSDSFGSTDGSKCAFPAEINYKPPGWYAFYGCYGGCQGPGSTYRTMHKVGSAPATTHNYDSKDLDETDWVKARAMDAIGNNADQNGWFLHVNLHDPHGAFTVPEEDKGKFDNAIPRLGDGYMENDVSDKPGYIREEPDVSGQACDNDGNNMDCTADYEEEWRKRQESLQAVDRLVKSVYDRLRETGQLGRTHIVFHSDNGWQMGGHRLGGKTELYEDSSNIPLIWRHPAPNAGAEARGRTVSGVTSTIDIAPTVLTGATGGYPSALDGRTLTVALNNGAFDNGWRKHVLLEEMDRSSKPDGYGVRGVSLKYNRYFDASGAPIHEEHYDLQADPEELDGTGEEAAAQEEALPALRACEGNSCRVADGGP